MQYIVMEIRKLMFVEGLGLRMKIVFKKYYNCIYILNNLY